MEFRVDASHAGEKVKKSTVPLLTPTKLSDAPTLSLKDLVPEQDDHDLDGHGQPESFKTERIEFVIVEREVDPEDTGASKTDRDYEWEIPDRSTFDAVIGEAIDKFTEDDWDRIDYVSFSSVGWNTGVGLFAFGSDKLVQMTMFRDIIRSISKGNKRFESYPKRMLLNRYALTIYFNAAFAYSTAPKLLFFFKKLNGFQGDLTIAETRFYPDNHPTRKGCKIVACEADQRFLDELYKYPKDHPFSIRYGGNLYVRGGERIDPDDPNAVRPSRPKLTRNAAKKFIHGAGEDILNAGQKADDDAAKKAKDDHVKNFVSEAVLFTVIHAFFWYLLCILVKQCNYAGWISCKKHCNSTRYSDRASKHKANFNKGYGTVGRCAVAPVVRIFERIMGIKGGYPRREKIKIVDINNDIYCIKLPMTIWKYEMYNDVNVDNIIMLITFKHGKNKLLFISYSSISWYWSDTTYTDSRNSKIGKEDKMQKGAWSKGVKRKVVQYKGQTVDYNALCDDLKNPGYNITTTNSEMMMIINKGGRGYKNAALVEVSQDQSPIICTVLLINNQCYYIILTTTIRDAFVEIRIIRTGTFILLSSLTERCKLTRASFRWDEREGCTISTRIYYKVNNCFKTCAGKWHPKYIIMDSVTRDDYIVIMTTYPNLFFITTLIANVACKRGPLKISLMMKDIRQRNSAAIISNGQAK